MSRGGVGSERVELKGGRGRREEKLEKKSK